MILSYAFKRIIRSWKLFTALLLGTMLAATFFAGINIGADTSAKQALNQQLSTITVDAYSSGGYNTDPSSSRTYGLSSQNWTSVKGLLKSVSGVAEAEMISRPYLSLQVKNETGSYYFYVTGIEGESRVYDGLTVTGGSTSLGANETYVVLGSKDQGKLNLGGNASFRISFSIWVNKSVPATVNLTLKVVDFVQLSEQARSIALGFTPTSDYNLLLVDWGKTIAPLIDFFYVKKAQYSLATTVAIYFDKEALIDPWDIPTSIANIQAIMSQMSNKVSKYRVYIYSSLQSILNNYMYTASSIMFNSLIIALPVFFMAWYMMMTVSNVIYNLRRREIGLLLTKGLSKGQLLRIFLSEALTIGLAGGAGGVAISLLLTPVFVGAFGGTLGTPTISWNSIILAISFSVIVTLLAIFQPARKAANLKAIDTLREYLYVQEERAYRKRLSWAAFILGTYKMAALTIGFSIPTSPPRWASGNFLLMIFYAVSFIIDNVLNYIGPLLFFWGFTKIFIIGSLKFQNLTSKATGRLLGGLSVMAARNVERSPVRVAATAFLVALIVGHSVSVIGNLASEQDYTVRDIYSSVGSDLNVSLSSTVNASQKLSQVAEISQVSAATLEYSFYASPYGTSGIGNPRLIAVNPEEWLRAAYYEEEWFIGSSSSDAFQAMKSDNFTIVLDRSVGKYLNLNKGDYIAFTLSNGSIYHLKVVGFFGSDTTQQQPVYITSPTYIGRSYWSYVPYGLYVMLKGQVSAQVRVLAKLKNVRDGESVATTIRSFSPKIGYVYSVDERLDKLQVDAVLTSRMNVQRIGVAFAILAASIGTVLVIMVSLNERKREICMMSVRGLSFRQLSSILFAEDLVVVLFSILLGLASGLIMVRGNIALASSQAVSSNPLIMRRMVFPLDSILTLSGSIAAIVAATIVPVLIILSRYLTQLDKVVRQA